MTAKQSYRTSLTREDLAYLVDLLDAQPFSSIRNSAYTKLLNTYSKALEGEIKPAYTYSTASKADKAFNLLTALEANHDIDLQAKATNNKASAKISKEQQWKVAFDQWIEALEVNNLTILTNETITKAAGEYCYLNDCWPEQIDQLSANARFERGIDVLYYDYISSNIL